jgi:hypothetical protein
LGNSNFNAFLEKSIMEIERGERERRRRPVHI